MRVLVVAGMLLPASAGFAAEVQLDGWRARIDPETLAVTALQPGAAPLLVAQGGTSRPVREFTQDDHGISWTFGDSGIRAELSARGRRLHARFTSTRDAQIEWPATGDEKRMSALIVPEGEGLYVPFTNDAWRARLAGVCLGLSSPLSMPFWSFDLGDRTLTYIVSTDLRSELCLADRERRLTATLRHEFQARDGDVPYEIEIGFGAAAPLAPALDYRAWLVEQKKFRTLEQKIADHPDVAKLAGAVHMYVWGDGRKTEFIDDLVKLGVQRAWIGYDQDESNDQKTLAGKEFVTAAIRAGYLVGPYESFANAQDPTTGDSVSRWPGKLYPEGCIVKRDGKPKAGFANRGCELSSEAFARAEPTLKPLATRVDRQLRDGANSYFVDVDAFGELYDDFSPAHPMTVFEDRENRLARLRYARDRKVVLGSEQAVAWSVPAIDFAHGGVSVQNGVLWAENRGADKPMGKWWPPDRPRVFFDPYEPSANFRAAKFDAAVRVPLYQAVFHDALVSVDRWEIPMAKLPSLAPTRQLFELLYGVPSIWAMDRRALREARQPFTALLKFFAPLHGRIATLPLTSFEWLTPDRLVQRTRFANQVTLTANFGARPFEGVGAGCIAARWLADDRIETFCPARFTLPAAKP